MPSIARFLCDFWNSWNSVSLCCGCVGRQMAGCWQCTTWVWWTTRSVKALSRSMTADIMWYGLVDRRRTRRYRSTSSPTEANIRQVTIIAITRQITVGQGSKIFSQNCRFYADVEPDLGSRLACPRPRLVKTGFGTSRDQDSSLENSKSGNNNAWRDLAIPSTLTNRLISALLQLATSLVSLQHISVIKLTSFTQLLNCNNCESSTFVCTNDV